MKALTVNGVIKASGLSRETLRYYEKMGCSSRDARNRTVIDSILLMTCNGWNLFSKPRKQDSRFER